MDDSAAKEAEILKLIDGWSNTKISDAQIEIYLMAVEDCSVEAVARSVRQFVTGKVERNNAFIPSAPEFAANARQWDEAIASVAADRAIESARKLVAYPIGTLPPPPLKPLGPIKVDLGMGDIDMNGWPPDLKERVLQIGGKLPDGRTMVGMTAEEAQRALDEPQLGVTQRMQPRLKRMGGG